MSASMLTNVYVGSGTGIFKQVEVEKKVAVNYADFNKLNKEEEIVCMCWANQQQTQIHLGLRNQTVKTFDTEEKCFKSSKECFGGEGALKGIGVHGDRIITCSESGIMKVWDNLKDDAHFEINVGENVCKMRKNAEKPNVFATGGKENDLKIWDINNKDEPIFKAKNVKNDFLDLQVPVWMTDVQFLPKSTKVLTGTGHHQIRIYDPDSQRRPVFEMTYDEYPITAVEVSTDGRSVFVGNTQGRLARIDLRNKQVLKVYPGFAGSIRCISLHPTEPMVATCGLDRFLRLHNVHTADVAHKVYLKSKLNCLLVKCTEHFQKENNSSESVRNSSKVKQTKEDADSDDDVWDQISPLNEDEPKKKTTKRLKNEGKKSKKKARVK
ncbi:WD repeat-containing protein 74-like [Anneissia japonica]|uniref:WD repeat-containing protein 74-like n=1 Tax=Anneissia japonica TaxID=1529436 RepID=UPI0014254E47|nr:WD repeat-containing protein 74-like [Anneissia japonica]